MSSNFDYFAIDNFNWSQGALPVTFGPIAAKVSKHDAHITWQTLSEINNDHFEVQVSTDGKSFTTVASVASKAPDGNSDATIHYETDFHFTQGTTTAGIYLLPLVFLGMLAANRRRAIPASLLVLGVAGWLSCSKNDNALPTNSPKYYLRIVQVDKDSVRTFSKTVLAENINLR